MKNLIVSFALLVCFSPISNAQQWVDSLYAVDTITDVIYGSAINFNNVSVDLQMDIFLPQCQDTSTKRPLLMVVHGGSFIGGNYKDPSIQNTCQRFAERGYVTVSVGYRLGFINDGNPHNCTSFTNYPCLYAADSSEWTRAYYRAIQDIKGATRYMVNRKDLYHIDEQNVFLSGESAGSFTVIGAAYMDDPAERPAETFAISDVLVEPHTDSDVCTHNSNQTFSLPISRPDLGGIEGNIEPALYPFTIRAVGNMYGGMMANLLTLDNSAIKPAMYSFHKACDLVVPWDSKKIDWGVSLCLSTCYSCITIYNTPIVHGSKTIADWNTNQSLGYDILSEFVTAPFPGGFACNAFPVVPLNCHDQIINGNDCHSYENKATQMTNMATFFASKMVNPEVCSPFNSIISIENNGLLIYPNPVKDVLHVKSDQTIETIRILDLAGNIIQEYVVNEMSFESSLSDLSSGVYMIECTFENQGIQEALIRR